jgi:hypothetical protein
MFPDVVVTNFGLLRLGLLRRVVSSLVAVSLSQQRGALS